MSVCVLILGCLIGSIASAQNAATAAHDPLPSWAEGPSKQAILAFVDSVTHEGGEDFVPVAERIATFDNDGCLWAEQPAYFQLLFAADRVKAMAKDHPEWQNTEPYQSLLAGDLKALAAQGEHAILDVVMASHAGMTTDEFESITLDWLKTAKHPRFNQPYNAMIYQPQVELLAYLRVNGFQTWIVSGGGIEFMRPWVEAAYGIPPEQVVGSMIKVEYAVEDGIPVLKRLPEIDFIDDKAGKPVGIHRHIGRRPIMAVGNSDGDFQMLEWVTSRPGPSLGVLIHHTDAEREWAYDRDSHIGKLDRGLDEGPERGWVIVDMAKQWRRVFAFEQP